MHSEMKVIHQHCMVHTGKCQVLSGISLLNEATARGFSTLINEQQSAAYVHVDDAVFVSANPSPNLSSDRLLDLTVGGLEEIGFQGHPAVQVGQFG